MHLHHSPEYISFHWGLLFCCFRMSKTNCVIVVLKVLKEICAKNVIFLSHSLAFSLLFQDSVLWNAEVLPRWLSHSEILTALPGCRQWALVQLSQPTELAEYTQSSWPETQSHSQSRKLVLKNAGLATTAEEHFQCYAYKTQFSFPSKSFLAKPY